MRVRCGDKVANGKSLAALLTLGAERDAVITLLARGDDQDDALAALVAAVDAGLGDDDELRKRRRRHPRRRPGLET